MSEKEWAIVFSVGWARKTKFKEVERESFWDFPIFWAIDDKEIRGAFRMRIGEEIEDILKYASELIAEINKQEGTWTGFLFLQRLHPDRLDLEQRLIDEFLDLGFSEIIEEVISA